MKEQFQKELKEKIIEGVKPSDIRKLKKSKSTGDIPKAPPLPTATPLSKSKSSETTSFKDPNYPYTTLVSQQEELEVLRKETETKSTTISLLRKKIENLEEKLKEPTQPTNTELDQHLISRHKSLKDWWQQYQQTKQLDAELKENIDEASQELISQDQTISQLRGQVKQLELTNQSLTKDLNLATKLAELRKGRDLSRAFSKGSLPNPENSTYLKYALYFSLALAFTFWLTNRKYE